MVPFYSQHVQRCKTLAKSPWEYFYQISLSFWAKMTCEMSLLLILEFLRVLIKHWLPIKSILCVIFGICRFYMKCNFLKNYQHFLNFCFHLWNIHQILTSMKKRWTVNMSKRPKPVSYLHDRTFIILFAHW